MRRSLPMFLLALSGLTACGTDGQDGLSCTVSRDTDAGLTTITCEDGTSAVIPDGLASTAAGQDGANGQDGAQGPAGQDGADGQDGAQGPAGQDGVDGQDGAPGQDGQDGAPGQDGADGQSCTGTQLPDGGFHIECPDGSSYDIPPPSACPVYMLPFGDGGYPELWVRGPDDLEPLRGCETIIGTLHIGDYTDLSALDGMRVLNGDLHLDPPQAGAPSLDLSFGPKLGLVTGDLGVLASNLHTISFPALGRVGGTFTVGDETDELSMGLTRVSAPVLTDIGDTLYVVYAAALETISMPSLAHVDTLSLEILNSLRTLDLPTLHTVREVDIQSLLVLTSLAPFSDALEEVDLLSLFNLTAMTSVSFPNLSGFTGRVEVRNSPQLERVDWSPTGVIDTLWLYFDPKLPLCATPYLQAVREDDLGLPSSDGATCDNCVGVANPDQLDTDRDHLGDACDGDIDGDGVSNGLDPYEENRWSCGDADGDTCDDCQVLGVAAPDHDGPDPDGDGACDLATFAVPAGCNRVGGTNLVTCRPTSWLNAAAACATAGGTLWEPRTEDDLHLSAAHDALLETWIGVSDIETEGSFVYASDDGALTIDPPWYPGEPNDSGTGEDCVQLIGFNPIRQTAMWNDLPCDTASQVYTCDLTP